MTEEREARVCVIEKDKKWSKKEVLVSGDAREKRYLCGEAKERRLETRENKS